VSDYLLDPQPGRVAPTIILQLIDGFVVATTGERPVVKELPYTYGWDPTFQEETADVVAATFVIKFEATKSGAPVMVQKVVKEEALGEWVVAVLNGADPR
jgi:hypothetical protein